jgi:hypothetical protein
MLFEGTDSIKFGMTHEEIQAILGKEPQLFRKGEFALYMTEDYANICHVYYEEQYSVAFEFFIPSQVFYNNIQLLDCELKELKNIFSNLENYECDSDRLSAFCGDFSVWGRSDRVESVYISRQGYSTAQQEYYSKKIKEKYNI